MNTEETITFFFYVTLCLGFMYLCYLHGKREGREDVASGRIKMFLVELKDKTKEWYTEKELNNLNDAEVALSIQSYLKNTGWQRSKSKREHIGIFTKEVRGKVHEIVLPLSRSFSDYSRVMLNAIKLIALVEERDYIQVLSDLLIAKPSDVI